MLGSSSLWERFTALMMLFLLETPWWYPPLLLHNLTAVIKCCVCSPCQRVSRGGAFCTNDNIINLLHFWEKLSKKPLCNSPGLVSLISDHFEVLIKALGFLPRKHTSSLFFFFFCTNKVSGFH